MEGGSLENRKPLFFIYFKKEWTWIIVFTNLPLPFQFISGFRYFLVAYFMEK